MAANCNKKGNTLTGRQRLEAEEKKQRLYIERSGVCAVCGKLVKYSECQLAHKIGQTKANLKKYGKEVLHNEKNLELVCGLACNSAVDISFRPNEVLKVLVEIQGDRKYVNI